MFAKLRSHLSYANAMATIAVFVALGGSSFAAPAREAAHHLISGRSIANSSLTGIDVKNSSLTTSDVKDRSLLAKDFKPGQLPQGSKGATGPAGAQGAAGANGATSVVIRTTTITGNGAASGTIPCNAGERATGGGFAAGGNGAGIRVFNSRPFPSTAGATPTAWDVSVLQDGGAAAVSVPIYVVCAAP